MRRFDYSFLKNLKVPSSFFEEVSTIYYLQAEERYQKSLNPDVFTHLVNIAIIQSVKGSNAIEGIATTDKRIEAIINQNANPLNHDEKEILGYKEALDVVHANHEGVEFSTNLILELNSFLTRHIESSNKGSWKQVNNIIKERLPNGESRIRWTPLSKEETPKAMEDLAEAYLEARNDYSINGLLLIPCVILDFLCIHPFVDGNGRMSRLLSILLLYENGMDIAKYISFEEQINKHKDMYYKALEESSIGWHENNNNYVPFMKNFLFTLSLCYKELDKRFLTLKSGKISKQDRIKEIMLSSFFPITKQEVASLLPDISITTIEKVIASLVKEGMVIKIGDKSNTKYRSNKK